MDSLSLAIDDLASPQTVQNVIPAFAQLLMVLTEFITPILFAWNMYDARMDQTTNRVARSGEESYDFIVGKLVLKTCFYSYILK